MRKILILIEAREALRSAESNERYKAAGDAIDTGQCPVAIYSDFDRLMNDGIRFGYYD